MKKEEKKIEYGAYYRKSSEDSAKQVNSNEDQKRDLDEIELREKLNVKIKFAGESQSAFIPGRPIFAELVKSIMSGKINAILVWHANRLSRNSIDAGQLIYLMDIGKLLQKHTTIQLTINFCYNLIFRCPKKTATTRV